jgi:hypothetical protein
MLAMTGSDYGAIVISVLMLVGLYFAVRFTVRVVKAPFRMLRRSPAPTGLGAQYEQLVRTEPQPSWALILPAPRVMGAETVEERSVPIKVV